MKILALLFTLLTVCGVSFANPMLSDSEVLKFKKTDSSFVISWVDGPKRGMSKFIMKTWKNEIGTMNGPYQDLPKTLNVFIWMPSMGHGSSPVKLKKINDGEYEVSDVNFIMGGKWEVKFQLKDGAQVFDETVVPVTI